MSFTATLQTPTKTRDSQRTKIILLTPTKRKRLSSDTSASSIDTSQHAAGPSKLDAVEGTSAAARTVANTVNEEGKNRVYGSRKCCHSKMELYQWTFTRAAIAPCFAGDVLSMVSDGDNDDLYWLGHVPCRTVRVVGVVVGLDNFEDMTRLKIDDGTAVIDCDCKHPKVHRAAPSPSVKRHKRTSSSTKPSSSRDPNTPSKSILAKYRPPPNISQPASIISQNKISVFAERAAAPLVDVGMVVRVTGRIMRGRGSRFLRVEPGNLVTCLSSNDEPQHWLEVTRLHRDSYSSSEPFIIPKIKIPQTQHTPEKSVPRPFSPSASSLIAPSSPVPYSSPTKPISSPVRASTASPQKPRLRHPSKLRTRDLTDVTFRMYLKHYMDFAPPYPFQRKADDLHPERCTTPTPTCRSRSCDQLDFDTPRPSTSAVSHSNSPATVNVVDDEDDLNNSQYGFTLSYLRRVPVLAEMARGVVRAERKRREREARQRAKAELAKSQSLRTGPSSSSVTIASSSKSSYKIPVHASTSSTSMNQQSVKGNASSEPTSKKMKRLFQKTIRELYADGSIVLWTGGARHWSHASGIESDEKLDEGSSAMWKTSTSTAMGNLSMVTTTTVSSRAGTQTQGAEDDDSGGELSEPNAREEAYLPVTTKTMAPLILGAIRTLSSSSSQAAPSVRTQPSSMASTGRSRPTGRKQRHPTASDILAYLHAMDMRWERLGLWTIEEVLEKLKRDDRIYQVGEGRWSLCV